MLALGIMGSPRKKGNTDFLLSSFMNEVEKAGSQDPCNRDCKKKYHAMHGIQRM